MPATAEPSRVTVSNLTPKSVGVTEAARLIGCSPRSVWRLLSTGDLKPVRIGRRTLVAVSSIDNLIERGGMR